MGDDGATTSGMRYGTQRESDAATAYELIIGAMHNGRLRLRQPGLTIPVGDGHLGASIDRVAKCDCGHEDCKGEWIVEIKCPETIESLPPSSEESIKLQKKNLYFDEEEDVIRLKESSAYYTQVQMQMGILGIPNCELWIWSSRAAEAPLAISIDFNEFFWRKLKGELDVFYMEFILPLLLQVA